MVDRDLVDHDQQQINTSRSVTKNLYT